MKNPLAPRKSCQTCETKQKENISNRYRNAGERTEDVRELDFTCSQHLAVSMLNDYVKGLVENHERITRGEDLLNTCVKYPHRVEVQDKINMMFQMLWTQFSSSEPELTFLDKPTRRIMTQILSKKTPFARVFVWLYMIDLNETEQWNMDYETFDIPTFCEISSDEIIETDLNLAEDIYFGRANGEYSFDSEEIVYKGFTGKH